MNTQSSKFNGFFHRQGILAAALLASLVVLGACSSDDDGGGDGSTGANLTAFNFDANNATLAAEIAATAMEFFPTFTIIGAGVIEILTTQDPAGSPFPVLGVCIAGGASLSWNDADGSGNLTVGDSATLTFNDCDFDGSGDVVNGTVAITATNVLPTTLGYTVAINLTISGIDSTTVAANFNATTSSPDAVNFTSVYSATDASGQTASITENGTEYFRMGCFNVTQMYTDAGLFNGDFDLSPSAVIVASNQVMSLAGGAGVTFVGDAMSAGTQRLLSIAVPECASVGVPGGVADSDGSYLDMEGTGGGSITLTTYDATDTQTSSVVTTWDLLTD